MTLVGAMRKIARVKSVRGNLYDNCFAASAVSTNSFYRAEDASSRCSSFCLFDVHCLCLSLSITRGMYSHCLFSSTLIFFSNLSRKNAFCLEIFFYVLLTCRSFDRDPHSTISFHFVKSPISHVDYFKTIIVSCTFRVFD